MKVGSLVERIPEINLCEKKTGVSVEGVAGYIPKGVVLTISGWQYCDKRDKDLFEFSIDGYEYIKTDKGICDVWYSPRIFTEIQPPMDMSFMDEVQMTKPKVKLLNPQS